MTRIRSLLEQWSKSPDDLGNGFAIAGIIVSGIGNFLHIAFLVNLGLAALGAGVVAWGVSVAQGREVTVLDPDIHFAQRIEELVARAWSILIIGGGLLLLGYGVLSALSPRSALPARLQQFAATPQGSALGMLGASMVGIVYSLTLIFASDATGNIIVRTIKSLPARLLGVVLLIFSGTLMVASVLQLLAPGTWDAWGHAFLNWAGLE